MILRAFTRGKMEKNMTYRFLIKYMGYTNEEIRQYESLTHDAERKSFREKHSRRLNYKVIIETILIPRSHWWK